MEKIFNFADDLGPIKIIHIQDLAIGLKAVLVVDNVAAGPSIGGLRIAADVTTEECFRLARAMTLKNAAAGLPHGGGKSVMVGNPMMPRADKEKLIRAMAQALRGEDMYIFGPDMGTNEECMAWVHDEIGRAVGLPRELGGIPLDELGATAYGMCEEAEVVVEFCDLELDGARVVVQGFGSVGSHAARFLAEKGCVLVGACDSRGGVHDPDGLDLGDLMKLKKAGRSVSEYDGARKIDSDAVIGLDCDIWIPAARPDVVNEDNVSDLKAKLILQGANIPITPGAEKILHERDVINLPDFIANAIGVICAAMEYQKTRQAVAFQTISDKIRDNTRQVLEASRGKGVSLREAAMELAADRVRRAMDTRRWSVF